MQFTRVTRKDLDTYKKFRDLYFNAFPKVERRKLFLLWLSSKLGKIDIFALKDNKEFVGLLITAIEKDIVWVDYLAISPNFRGQGYGSKTLDALKDYYGDKRIFLEVETPLNEVDNYHQRLKRIDFYKQNGFSHSGLRVSCFDCDFTILSYNGAIKFHEYIKITKTTYGFFTYILSKIEKIETSYNFKSQTN